MKKFLIGLGVFTLVLIGVFVVFGGYAVLDVNKLTPGIEKTVEDFYAQYNDQKFDSIYDSLADDKYKGVATKDVHLKFLGGVYRKMGKVERKEKGAWRINYAPDGVYYSVQYQVTRERGRSDDSFLLKKNGDAWRVAGYNVNSPDLI